MFKAVFTSSRQQRFEKQVRPYLTILYQYAFRLTGGHADDAEDIVQDLLLNLYNREIELASLANARTWLFKSLYHQFIDFTRKQKRTPSVPDSDDDERLAMEEQADALPDESLHQQQLGACLEQALNQLEPELRMLVLLHEVEGYTLVEIAEIMDTPLGTLKSRLHRTRKALRNILQGELFRDIRRDSL